MNDHIGVSTNRRSEVSVEREIEGVVFVFRNVERSGTEIFRSLHRFRREMGERHSGGRILDRLDRLHERSRARSVEIDVESFHSVDEGGESSFDRRFVTSEECLIR